MAMTEEKVLFAVAQIEEALREEFPEIGPQQIADPNTINERVRHLLYMCETIPDLLRQGRREKVMRWLGFLQGSAWLMRIRTIDEMKNDNKPDDSDI